MSTLDYMKENVAKNVDTFGDLMDLDPLLDPERQYGGPHQDAIIYWRGSLTDLVTDLEPLLTPAHMAKLAMLLGKRASGNSHR